MRALALIGWFLVVVAVLIAAGCGGKVDETKPLGQVREEAAAMSARDLRSMALSYQKAIEAKKSDVEKLALRLKEVPITQALGEEAKKLRSEMQELKASVRALAERFRVYVEELRKKNGDLSGIQL